MMVKRVVAALLLLLLAVPVYASNENGCDDDCDNGNGPKKVKIDVNAKGGKAKANAEADARASAAAHAGALAYCYVKGGDQYQKAYQSLYASFKVQQAQLGIVSNVGPQVVIGGDVFEAAASSAFGPSIDVDQINVECPIFVQDGVSIGGSIVEGSGSLGWTDAEKVNFCIAWLVTKNTKLKGVPQEDQTVEHTLAALTAYCSSFEAIGVDNKKCKDWRHTVAGTVPPTPEERERETRAFDDPSDRS